MNAKVFRKTMKMSCEFTILFLMILCLRGMLLGNLYPVLGMALGAGLLITNVRKKVDTRIYLFILCCVFWGYCVLQGIFLGSNSTSYLIQIFFYWTIETGAAFLIFQKKEKKVFFCRSMIKILAFISCSYIISLVLGIVLSWSKITYFQLDYNYFYKAPFLFPVTFVYGSGNVFGIEIYRLLGIARESGIMQCLFSWGFFSADRYFIKPQRIKILLFLGLIGCMSTTGFVIFFSILAINQLTKSVKKLLSFQTLGIVIVIVLAVLFLLGDSTFGLGFRWKNSFSDRTVAMDYGIKNFSAHPIFGIGFFKNSGTAMIQAEANFIASLGNIGIIGGILFGLIYLYAFICSDDKRFFLTTNSDFFLTALIAQPLYVSPLMYIFLFSGFTNTQKNKKYETRNDSNYLEG